jgi:hypothetical protein
VGAISQWFVLAAINSATQFTDMPPLNRLPSVGLKCIIRAGGVLTESKLPAPYFVHYD